MNHLRGNLIPVFALGIFAADIVLVVINLL
jgi:hypothetical protein